MAREQEIPFVFALGRKALGRCVNKLVPVSVVGIFNYSGAEVSHCSHRSGWSKQLCSKELVWHWSTSNKPLIITLISSILWCLFFEIQFYGTEKLC